MAQMVNGGWYNGRQYWNGQLGPPGVIINPNQQGAGQRVSSEVNRQSDAAQGKPAGTTDSYLEQLRKTDRNPIQEQEFQRLQQQTPQQSINQAIEDSFKKLQSEVVSKFGEYKAGHPFNVDQVLAEKSKEASEQLDPYYKELIGDYMKGVTNKISRSTEDTKALLSELNASTTSYTGQTLFKLNQTIKQAEEGFAESGLFNSGARYATEGLLKKGTNDVLSDYKRAADFKGGQIAQQNQRTIEDANLDATQRQREVAREQYTNTQTLAGQLTKEAGQEYVRGFNAILPPQLQASNGFDALKSIGIYS